MAISGITKSGTQFLASCLASLITAIRGVDRPMRKWRGRPLANVVLHSYPTYLRLVLSDCRSWTLRRTIGPPNLWQENALNDRIVALNMRLPVLTNVPVKEILQYRNENRASFERFRRALREAVKEQIEQSGTDSPGAIADEVVATRIRPELADIEVQLAGIRKTLMRKMSANIALTGAAVSVGAMENVPLVIAATAAAAATSVYQIVNKNADNKEKAEQSDWYFLWKAQPRHHR